MGKTSPEEENKKENTKTFIHETVVPKSKGFRGKKLVSTIGFALLFSFVLAASFPLFHRLFPEKEDPTLPAETLIFRTDDDPANTAAEGSETEAESTEENSAAASTEEEPTLPAETTEEPTTEEEPSSTLSPEELASSIAAAYDPDLDDYKALYACLSDLVSQTSRALVTVTARNYHTDWFESDYSYETQTFGVIVGITSQEVLILTPMSDISRLSEESALAVSFGNKTAATAYVKATDTTDDLAVLAVSVSALSVQTREYIYAIELGNSYACYAGQPVILLGAPAGQLKSVNYGILTNIESEVNAADNQLQILHTDVSTQPGACGFIISLDGGLVGWLGSGQTETCLSAIGISGLKSYIENLSSGISIGYLGVKGRAITAPMVSEGSFPQTGFYLTECLDKSPALEAGLQSGDILIEMAGTDVGSASNLRSKLLSFNTEQTVKVTVLRKSGTEYQTLIFDVHISRR